MLEQILNKIRDEYLIGLIPRGDNGWFYNALGSIDHNKKAAGFINHLRWDSNITKPEEQDGTHLGRILAAHFIIIGKSAGEDALIYLYSEAKQYYEKIPLNHLKSERVLAQQIIAALDALIIAKMYQEHSRPPIATDETFGEF